MKKQFSEYYVPTEEEFKALWDNCIFSPDANVLLNVYRYSESLRSELLAIFSDVGDRLWVTHQAAHEFYRNRISEINEKKREYNAVKKQIRNVNKGLKKSINGLRHPLIDEDHLLSLLEDGFKKSIDYLSDIEQQHPDLLVDDQLLNDVTELFDKKVGESFTDSETDKLHEEADGRYKKNRPPGFEDREKKGEIKYGDYILWKQLLDKARTSKKPIIFITDDSKKDWWSKGDDSTPDKPHPELVREMRDVAGVMFYAYSAKQFMSYARTFLNSSVTEESLQEAQDVGDKMSVNAFGSLYLPNLGMQGSIDLSGSNALLQALSTTKATNLALNKPAIDYEKLTAGLVEAAAQGRKRNVLLNALLGLPNDEESGGDE